jgi:hypothetical protein
MCAVIAFLICDFSLLPNKNASQSFERHLARTERYPLIKFFKRSEAGLSAP